MKADLEVLRETFGEIFDSNDTKWANSKLQAEGYSNKLSSFEFVYWLEVFGDIFKATDVMYQQLQLKKLNIGWAGPCVETCVRSLEAVREDADNIYDRVALSISPPTSRKRKRNTRLDDFVTVAGGAAVLSHKDERRAELFEVVDTMLRCIKERFGGLDQFKFMSLLDMTKCGQYTKKFPEKELSELRSSVYGKLFDLGALESDLRYVYRAGEFKVKLDELVQENHDMKLQDTLPEFCKLARLGLTIALTISSAERSFSALARIKTDLRSTMLDTRLSNLSIMSINSRVMEGLDNELIIDRFAGMVNRRIKLIYRQ